MGMKENQSGKMQNGKQKNCTSFDGEQFSTFILLIILIFLGFFGSRDIELPELPLR
ncbi:hypothetical protein [Aneurinibacillus migulanus]|nr:hypothetical protein [Aneurinibacillus migulanus]MED0892113.1 hypothetical protein [Aneurinibacillus migulanus]MED1618722.1 hypothetical protein [Aneurinibacillus migulanus]GED13392.1 hypothetical protein AMI01nite_13830 [Aneurinibacillus migulanus]